MSPPRILGLCALGLVACGSSRESGSPGATTTTPALSQTATLTASAAPAAAPSGTPAAPSSPPPGDDEEPPGPPVEAERRTLNTVADEPAVYDNRDFIADHWGVVQLPFPLQLQTIRLPRSRRALLLTGQGPALDKPLVLVVGPENTVLWSKPKPLAGTHEQARELTLTRGPRGHVLLFLYDEPSKVFAGRAWTHEGGIFADFQVLTADTCDGASALYWPGQGWVAALLSEGALHVQLLGENGTLRFPGGGLDIPPPTGSPPPAAAPQARPKIAIAGGKTIEISIGARKVRVSADGALLR